MYLSLCCRCLEMAELIKLGPATALPALNSFFQVCTICAPATPSMGIVILATVPGTAGIPTAGIALLRAVDRILDMSRTAVNVAGDLVTCLLAGRDKRRPASHRKRGYRRKVVVSRKPPRDQAASSAATTVSSESPSARLTGTERIFTVDAIRQFVGQLRGHALHHRIHRVGQ